MEALPNDLIEQARNPDAVERGRAAEALGAMGGEPAVEALVHLLEDPDVIVRFKAAMALAWLERDQGVPVLVWALGRKELCFMALEALAEIGSPAALPEIRRFFSRWHLHPLERLQAAAALHRCGDDAGTDFLRTKLGSSRPEERGFALELWGKLRMPGALDLLHEVLTDPNDPQRMDAARGLGHLGDPRSLPLLDRLSRQQEDPDLADVAEAAATAIREAQG
jgi:HEAT repeat protein